MEKIILIGGGGHCKSVIDVLEQDNKFKIEGIVDQKEQLGLTVLGYKIIATDSDLKKLSKQYAYALITVGQVKTASVRINLFHLVKEAGFILPKVISPKAYISPYAKVGEGTIVMHDALVNADAKIGQNCIINSKALIEHDCLIEDHCHISTGAILNGGVTVHKESFVGSHATVREGIVILDNSFVKAGSLVK